MNLVETARDFAAALDARDYAKASQFLATDCRYCKSQDNVVVGVDEILRSYSDSDTKARRLFDGVLYRSEAVVNAGGGIRLIFFDELHCGDSVHTFRCSQVVHFDVNQTIDRIELVELPGERELLNEFCARHGVQLES